MKNKGTGFSNINNDANYTGTNTSILQLNNVPASWNAYQYHVVVDGNTSAPVSLQFVSRWTGAVNSAWENPGNWSCGMVPDSNTDVIISSGTIAVKSSPSVRSLVIRSGAAVVVNTGYYFTVTL